MSDPWMVYIAGPFTTGDPEENIHNALDATAHLMTEAHEAGLVVIPVVPHLWATIPEEVMEEEDWMEVCLGAVGRCDALIRLPGESPGADEEVDVALAGGTLVFDSIHAFIYHASNEGEEIP